MRSFSGGQGIFITRNPYDAIISYHNFLYGGHTGHAPATDYGRPEWPYFFMDQTRRWLATAVNWTIHSSRPFLVVHYEKLREDPLPELRRIVHFLRLPTDERRLYCIVKYPQAKFRRKGRSGVAEESFLSGVDRTKVDRAIRYVDYLIRSKTDGNPPLPLDLYSYYNGSDRIKGKRRAELEHSNDQQSWTDWLTDIYYRWGSDVIQSTTEKDPLAQMTSDGARGGGMFYTWQLPFDPAYDESTELEQDFNSGPPDYIFSIKHGRLT